MEYARLALRQYLKVDTDLLFRLSRAIITP